MICKTLHRKLKIEQHGHHLEPWMNSGDPEGVAVPVLHCATSCSLVINPVISH